MYQPPVPVDPPRRGNVWGRRIVPVALATLLLLPLVAGHAGAARSDLTPVPTDLARAPRLVSAVDGLPLGALTRDSADEPSLAQERVSEAGPAPGEGPTAEPARGAPSLRSVLGTRSGGTISSSAGARVGGGGPVPLLGPIDAGGPYGGSTTFEGGPPITFTVTSYDPSVIFYRWDFNNDSLFDYPDQTGAGTLGRWTTETSVVRQFFDDYRGDIRVEGWDGVSTRTETVWGNNLGETGAYGWFLGYGPYEFAWMFRAKEDLAVTHLGRFNYGYVIHELSLWSGAGTLLGTCEPETVNGAWTWCSLATPIALPAGGTYVLGIRIQTYTTGIDTPPDTAQADFQGTYYCAASPCFPNVFYTDAIVPMIDFRWEKTLLLPDAAQDAATVEVHNVAPDVFNVSASPASGPEGDTIRLTAEFDDPGLEDTWEARWILPDGQTSPWARIERLVGGAKVLVLTTWGATETDGLVQNLKNACGFFCRAIDTFDFGPLGLDRVPSLDEVGEYNLVLVGTDYMHTHASEVGDLLADAMDSGLGVVMMQAAFDSTFGTNASVTGRWETDAYSPILRGPADYDTATLGTVQVPGHPLLDGVGSLAGRLRANTTTTTAGAVRIADWSDVSILAATKPNPIAGNGALACALNLFPYPGWAGGDAIRLIVNAIRYCSQQPDPYYRTMPIALDPFEWTPPDDLPSTTPSDPMQVVVEVRDDDHARFDVISQDLQYAQDFQSRCGWSSFRSVWPPGWSADPAYGWRCLIPPDSGSRGALVMYLFNDHNTSDLRSPTFDLSAFDAARIVFDTSWRGNYPAGDSDGYLDASVDGGGSFPHRLGEFHHDNPSEYRGPFEVTTSALAAPGMVLRFRYVSADDWWWFVDNVRVYGIRGAEIDGLGIATGTATIGNVEPVVTGGSDILTRDGNGTVLFQGYVIEDPALFEPTEWFAYAWDFGDGMPIAWTYVGNMTVPRYDVLLLHTLCLQGNACGWFTGLRDMLLSLDDVALVDGYNFLNYPSGPSAPTLGQLLQYDAIVVATNNAYFLYPPFEVVRRQVGDRLAEYLDAGRGGVITTMAAIDVSPVYGDRFSIGGRYVDEDYGPFERATFAFGGATLGTLLEAGHDVLAGVREGFVDSLFLHSGDYAVTVGGMNAAANRNGTLLADWSGGNSAIGAKELNNGMRAAHIGAFPIPSGPDVAALWRNAIGWVTGGLPSPRIPPMSHTFGNSPPYDVDLMVVDDDMGWIWDPGTGTLVEVLPPATISHRHITVLAVGGQPKAISPPGSLACRADVAACQR